MVISRLIWIAVKWYRIQNQGFNMKMNQGNKFNSRAPKILALFTKDKALNYFGLYKSRSFFVVLNYNKFFQLGPDSKFNLILSFWFTLS